jgi:hypothetical protein
MRPYVRIALAVLLTATDALARATTSTTLSLESSAPAVAIEPDKWSFAASASTYILQDEGAYVQPTLIADRDWLHLEARYNYEALTTASFWIGYNLSFGKDLVLDLTPMVGGVIGDVSGAAPGYRLGLTWQRFEFTSEAEYLFDAAGSSGNFFYCWNEITYSPEDWCWFGVAAQRTRAYESDLDLQPGLLAGFAWKQLNFTAYLFSPGSDDMAVVLSVGVDF